MCKFCQNFRNQLKINFSKAYRKLTKKVDDTIVTSNKKKDSK